MTYEEFKTELLEKSKDFGCEAAEVYYSESESFSVQIQDKNIDKYKVANDISLSLRVVYNGHDGFASTEIFENAEELIKHAIDNAKTVDTTEDHPMQGKSVYASIKEPEQPLCKLSERECIDLARSIEEKTFECDPRVKRTMGCTVGITKNKVAISNTLGLDAFHESINSGTNVTVVMDDNGEENVGYAYYDGINAHKVDELVDEAVRECVAKFSAKPVPSGEYKVLFTNKGFIMMLELFSGIFSADAAQKGLSLLAGKEGEMIASECVTLCDDPLNTMCPMPFDAEGVPARFKTVIENGRLITLLHSLKTAKKAGIESTGNGTRTGSCVPTNFYIKPGSKSFDELVQGDKVLVISELDGAGTGVNEISGEFSLSARGQLYENGVCVSAVNQITVAGSFFDLMKNIIDKFVL